MSMCALFVFDHSYDMFFCMCLHKRKKTSHVCVFGLLLDVVIQINDE